MDTYHEMDDHGNHRITVDGHTSEWVTYQSLPHIEVDNVQYIAASQYWFGYLPVEVVLKVEVASTETKNYRGRGENPVRVKLDQ